MPVCVPFDCVRASCRAVSRSVCRRDGDGAEAAGPGSFIDPQSPCAAAWETHLPSICVSLLLVVPGPLLLLCNCRVGARGLMWLRAQHRAPSSALGPPGLCSPQPAGRTEDSLCSLQTLRAGCLAGLTLGSEAASAEVEGGADAAANPTSASSLGDF